MNIGFVSTWLHRGAAYVTMNYAKLLMPEHKVFVYGRGGEFFDRSLTLDGVSVYEGIRTRTTDGIVLSDFHKWITSNSIDIVIWNEQRDLSFICLAKKKYPDVIHGAYIDYYKEDMVEGFGVFDFLICNTKRHFSVFKWHQGCHYMPWGCDTELYSPSERPQCGDRITFFHSMGMSDRKGTDILVRTFVRNGLNKYGAKLVIHTQVPMDSIITEDEAKASNVEIVKGTYPAPGLYFRGDVYVYPAKLDGLGLTMYEAISCGLPVIATDTAPMNEVIDEDNGYLVSVNKYYSRSDGYYWPLAEVSSDSLLLAMKHYIDHSDEIKALSKKARQSAVEKWNLSDRKQQLLDIVSSCRPMKNSAVIESYMKKHIAACRKRKRREFIDLLIPDRLYSLLLSIERKLS